MSQICVPFLKKVITSLVLIWGVRLQSQGGVPPLPVLFTLFGVATSFISTGLAWQMVRCEELHCTLTSAPCITVLCAQVQQLPGAGMLPHRIR